jgi:PAS domain S-box-containing protein
MGIGLETVDILIVDDRMDGLLALEAALSCPNWRLSKAQSGHEAVNLCSNHDFALILLDVQMPGIDGFQAAEMIRSKTRNRTTPIIFVTAINKDDLYIYRGYEAGAVDYVFKPFDPHILRSKVAVFADLYEKTRKLERQTEIIRESERRERYLKLAELEVENLRRYRSLADAVPHIIWKANADGVFDYVNRGWTDYTGQSVEQSQGNGWQRAVHNGDLERILRLWLESMRTLEPFEAEIRLRREDGEFRWHLCKVVPEILGTSLLSWIGTNTDIHDRKIIADRLIVSQREAQSANLAKTNFLANMSHEIRTPLNAILGFAELIFSPDQSHDENIKAVETIRRSGTQLLRIINEILDISKIEAGHMEVEEVEVDVPAMVEEVRSLLELQASDKGLKLDFRIMSPLPRRVVSDPVRLKQILMNLVGNAVKFTSKGEVVAEFGWTPDDGGKGQLKVYVRDTGPGIAEQDVDRLFRPFSQVDNSMTRRFGGTGLGLILSKQLAQLLGGDVRLERSEPGLGSVFYAEASVKPVGKKSEFISSFKNENIAKPVVSSQKIDLSQYHILLVDDSADNQVLIGRFLRGAGANVVVANDGIEAVSLALDKNPDFVLMDIQMPRMDGYEATRVLRGKGFHKPIIALTAHALKEEREKSLQAGCNGHLTKPIEKRALLEFLSGLSSDEKIGKTALSSARSSAAVIG